MTFDRSLRVAEARPDDEDALAELARAALGEGREDEALPLLKSASTRRSSARLWQWTGLIERALERHEDALGSFARAATLAPGDASIVHGRARIALEAGIPADDLFKAARRLSPRDSDVFLGHVASLYADGHGAAAEEMLDNALAGSPLWIDGHVQLAQLRSMVGKRDQARESLDRALQRYPQEEQLWAALFRLLMQSERFQELDEAIARARRSPLRASATLMHFDTIAAIEQRQNARADQLLEAMPADLRQSIEVWRIRHLLRTGRISKACDAIEAALKTDLAPIVWPYATIAWRIAGDPRWQWLEGDLDRFVSVIDLGSKIEDFGALEHVLRELHTNKGEFLDQSVRGGSQTDGPLFTKIDPAIRSLRTAIVSAVENYVQSLPPIDAAHPLLGQRRDRGIAFAGSWSVLLRSAGYHSNHVHPQGWISSAMYVRLPQKSEADPSTAGWLTLGAPQEELGLDLAPLREIEPKQGQLVLFPSYMWHGTRPFSEGERLSVAFDVRRPS